MARDDGHGDGNERADWVSVMRAATNEARADLGVMAGDILAGARTIRSAVSPSIAGRYARSKVVRDLCLMSSVSISSRPG